MLGTILLIILILILIGALPTWPYSSGWGYYPSGGAGLILIIVIILLLMGRLARPVGGRPSVSERHIDRAELRPAVLFVEIRRAQHLRVGDAHAVIRDGKTRLGLGDERPVRDAQAVAVGIAVEEDVAADRLAVHSGEQVPAEAAVADEGLGARQRRAGPRRAEVVAQVLADAGGAADIGKN